MLFIQISLMLLSGYLIRYDKIKVMPKLGDLAGPKRMQFL